LKLLAYKGVRAPVLLLGNQPASQFFHHYHRISVSFVFLTMKNILSLLTFIQGAAFAAAASCNADNCARAVTGTVYGAATSAAHRADCSSFFMVTITPATSTITITNTVSTTTIDVTSDTVR
jgi:hypothetical protein